MNFKKYFPSEFHFPNVAIGEILPLGHLWSYVSHTFLNGMINYVKIEKAFLTTYYMTHAENVEAVAKFIASKPYHTDFGFALNDNVLILARSEPRDVYIRPSWWFFRYDRDCSDCEIGRFETYDVDEVVMARFVAFAEECSQSKSYTSIIELPCELFTGWIKG